MALTTVSAGRLGHYRILRRLGSGGMAEIYLAYDECEQREVALKVVDMALDDHVLRFQREVAALRLLKHEHILPIFDAGEQDGWWYFAMPYLPLGSLRERLRHGPLTLEEAGGIFWQVADALHYAHEHGVLHRDIKPSNVLFRNEQDVYLADFGLAKLVEQEGSITQTGCLVGTPHYLAPELANEDASQKSDQYALGILLYKMLTGKVPFQGSSAVTICWKHIHDQPLPPSSLNPAMPAAIDQLILRALEKDPAHRFSSAREMAEAYQQALHELNESRETGRRPAARAAEGRTRTEASSAPTNHEARESARRLVGAELASVLANRSALVPSLSALFQPNRFYRAATAGAMIMALCVAPLYLGFSLYLENMEPAQVSAHVQPASAFLAAQPLLARNNQPVSGQAQSLPFVFPPTVVFKELLANGENQFSDESSQGSKLTGQTLSRETEEILQFPGKKGRVQLHARGNGKHSLHRKAGKQPGHGGRKKQKGRNGIRAR